MKPNSLTNSSQKAQLTSTTKTQTNKGKNILIRTRTVKYKILKMETRLSTKFQQNTPMKTPKKRPQPKM